MGVQGKRVPKIHHDGWEIGEEPQTAVGARKPSKEGLGQAIQVSYQDRMEKQV